MMPAHPALIVVPRRPRKLRKPENVVPQATIRPGFTYRPNALDRYAKQKHATNPYTNIVIPEPCQAIGRSPAGELPAIPGLLLRTYTITAGRRSHG